MSDAERAADDPNDSGEGPNLKLIYALIALALIVAIGLAAMVVLPFYLRR
jgi:hypothetical protein